MFSRAAPAKVNLMLHVVDRLSKGYHRLQSLITFVDVEDNIEIQPHLADAFTLSGCFASSLEVNDTNSVLKAKEFFYEYFRLPVTYFSIHLEKNLPIAAGIGGGTSDAAAMLALLIQFHGLTLSDSEKEKVVQASGVLGADVPVCLAFQLGLGNLFWLDGSGVDEMPRPLFLPQPLYFVLVNPKIPVATGLIFKNLRHPFTSPIFLPDFSNSQRFFNFLLSTRNDLEEVAHKTHVLPDLSDFKGEADLVRQSGSGATLFMLTDTAIKAKNLQAKVQTRYPSWWVESGKTF